MKKFLKRTLKSIGLFNLIRNKYVAYDRKQYKDLKTWSLKIKNTDIHYSTSDSYSWNWFYGLHGIKPHEPIATKIFIDNITKDQTVIDIGAHLGYFTLISASIAGQVFTLEVDPNCINRIQKNIKLNNFHNVKVFNLAASNRKGFIKIPEMDNPDPCLSIGSQNATLEVACDSIDNFIEMNNIEPDFIKIDVEGAEGLVLEGMEGILHKDIKILMELHTDFLEKQFDTDYKDLLLKLTEYGFKIQQVDHRYDVKNPFKRITPDEIIKGNTMIFCEK